MFKTKLGKNKGVERSRIWIEGKRLTGAGFHAKATKYTAKVVEVFNGCEYVNVEYSNGVIKITAGAV